jgi:hypothetical protein
MKKVSVMTNLLLFVIVVLLSSLNALPPEKGLLRLNIRRTTKRKVMLGIKAEKFYDKNCLRFFTSSSL